MDMSKMFIGICVVAFAAISCSHQSGVQEKEVGDFVFKLRRIESTEENKNPILQFVLELSVKDKSQDLVKFLCYKSGWSEQEVLYYLSYQFQNDIYMVNDGQKFKPELFHFERSFDLKTQRTINLGFLLKAPVAIQLNIDSELFNVGIVKIELRDA